MKVFDCPQYGEEWERLKLGRPSASQMHRIVCPEIVTRLVCVDCKQTADRRRKSCACGGELIEVECLKESAQREKYIYELAFEILCAGKIGRMPLAVLQRGHDWEAAAIANCQFLRGYDVHSVGCAVTDDEHILASPDGAVDPDGLVEAKSHEPELQLIYLDQPGRMTKDHYPQVQSQMLVWTDRKWVDLIGYSQLPDGRQLPSVLERVERDEKYIGLLNDRLVPFIADLYTVVARLRLKHGEFPQIQPKQPAVDPLGFDVTEADVDRILAKRN